MSTAGDLRRGAQRLARRAGRRMRRRLSRVRATLRAPSRRLVRQRVARLQDVTRARAGDLAPPPDRSTTVVLVDARGGRGRAAIDAVNRSAREASTDVLVLLSDTSEPLTDDWETRLAGALGEGTVGATPLLVHPPRPRWRATPDDVLTRELGIGLARVDGEPQALARGAGTPPDPDAPRQRVDALSAACAAVDRAAFVAVGGLRDLDDVDAAMVDLSVRLRAAGGELVTEPSVVVTDHRPVGSAARLRHALDPEGPGWRALVERSGPLLLRSGSRPPDQLTFSVTTAAPSLEVAPRWGDWHLAEGLARALVRLGHGVRVQSIGEVDALASRSCDVQLVVRGKQPVRRTAGQRHVLWVISHPDLLTVEECDEADLVLVASERFAGELAARTATPVAPLLQATDPGRFRPVSPDPAWAHPVLIVANARHVLRPVVADALAAGLRPAIVGRGWDRLVDPALVVAEQVPNERLATVYASAGVLLNDHWPDMRARGFVSNRVFDALACGTPLVSDPMPELAELFGEAVATYRDAEQLRNRVDDALGNPAAARARAAAGRDEVVARHTFDHRARQLLDLLAAHGLDELPA